MRRKTKLAFALWLALAIGAVVATTVSADSRCNGSPGYDVWQDTNKGGPSARTCGISSTTWRPNYSGWTTNLSFFANWNDRVSSVETFNFTGHKASFYRDPDYGYALLVITNNEYVNDMNDWNANDRVSSSKTPY